MASPQKSPERGGSARPHPPAPGQPPQQGGRMNAPAPTQHRAAGGGRQQPQLNRSARPGEPQPNPQQRGRNPIGSPPPPGVATAPPRRQQQGGGPQQQHQQHSQQHQHQHQQQRRRGDSEGDDAARAALALAAVAQAASASNKSPAEAAEIAKAQAQLVSKKNPHHHHGRRSPTDAGGAHAVAPRKMQNVPLEGVKELLSRTISNNTAAHNHSHNHNEQQQRQQSPQKQQQQPPSSSSLLLEKLSHGDNDAFLQHLLFMEHLRAIEPASTPTDASNNINTNYATEFDSNANANANAATESGDPETEHRKISYACDRVALLLSKVELAYDSLSSMLPPVPSNQHKQGDVDHPDDASYEAGADDDDNDDVETPKVVPDLLPPCTSKPGDATQEFFRACLGEPFQPEEDAISSEDRHHHQKTGNDGMNETTDLDSHTTSTSTNDNSHQHHDGFSDNGEEKHGSVFSSMFNMKRASFNKKTFANVFGSGKKRKGGKNHDDDGSGGGGSDDPNNPNNSVCQPGEYSVMIEREMLGLTVENVLERTVVRTVLAGGPAKKAGAKVGSLIVKVGNIETRNLTHFETIDELRQSQRPLQLVLRQISDDALRSAREEMGRLIRGSGFGRIIDGEHPQDLQQQQQQQQQLAHNRPPMSHDRNIDLYTTIVRKRCIEMANVTNRNKRDEPILRVAEKLIWILSLFVVGLERESARLLAYHRVNTPEGGEDEDYKQQRSHHSQYHHTAKDYAEAAKSVSKVLFDFIKKRMEVPGPKPNPAAPPPPPPGRGGRGGRGRGARGGRGPGRGGRGMSMIPGMPSAAEADDMSGEKLLLQIGDVLQRTRGFLADPTSPPAALLRGEIIACLCDILDADTEMKLSEEENMSATQGGNSAGPITDLGAAGSLLKLIVLNCPIMRSPGCEEISISFHGNSIEQDELKRRFGQQKKTISGSDFHRLHAGNRFLAVVHRLAASRSTSARITACSLGPVLWSHLDFPHQLQLRGVITRALHDVEVIVRKSTATVLHEIAELVFDPRCVPWLVLMCERAMTDPEPLLRSAAMTLTWHLAEHLPNAFLGDASKGSRYLRRLPSRDDPIFADVYLLQCKLLPVATRLAEDRAPQVRLAVAAQCDRLCDALGDHWSSVIIDVLVALLTDSDERVRSEAVMCVPRLADVVLMNAPPGVIPAGESSVLDALIPAAIKLQKDASASVRIALATAAGELLTLLVGLQRSQEQTIPKVESSSSTEQQQQQATTSTNRRASIRYEKRHVDERLIPLVQRLLHDADPEVTSSALRAVTNASRGTARELRARFNTEDDDSQSIASMTSYSSIEKKDPVFLPVLSEEQVLRLLPTLSELANSKQWRVRQSAVEIVPALLGCTTKFETRAEIARLCIRLTADKIDAVRRTAAECLCLGGGSLGSHGEDVSGEWITALVIPQVQACAKHSDYRQRLLCLKMVEVILLNDVCPAKWKDDEKNLEGKNTPLRELLKVTLSLAEDRIANVRLNVGKVLGTVLHVFGEEECRVIKYALLQQLKKERSKEDRQDRDVLYFANKCIDKLRNRFHHHDGVSHLSPTAATATEETTAAKEEPHHLTAL